LARTEEVGTALTLRVVITAFERRKGVVTAPKPIFIRRARPEDAASIWSVRTRAIRELCRGCYTDKEINDWASSPMPPTFATVMRDTEFFVAEQDATIIGHAFLDTDREEIAAVFVSPDHVRTGVGSRLLKTLEKRARAMGLRKLHLVSTKNATAFYASAGYVELEASLFQHPDGFALACIKMEKIL
jgi:GNAT superfamily N-acetyltransferase